ncbi:MAG TPA: DUF202 domain-containing protein [Bacillales bacterium]
MENKKKENQLKYAQQHLANERTFLAWIRTAVAIIGIGFLATSLHFTTGDPEAHPIGNLLVIVLGFSTGIFGVLTIIAATISYLSKEKQIKEQTFYSSHKHIYFFSLFLILITFLALLYVSRLL